MSIYLNIQILVVQFWQTWVYPTASVITLHACAQSCPNLCDPMDCSHGSSVPATSQAKLLECVAISYSGGSSWHRDQTLTSCMSCIGRQTNGNISATWEVLVITQDISVSLDGSLLLLTSSLATTLIFFFLNLRLKSQALVRTRFKP